MPSKRDKVIAVSYMTKFGPHIKCEFKAVLYGTDESNTYLLTTSASIFPLKEYELRITEAGNVLILVNDVDLTAIFRTETGWVRLNMIQHPLICALRELKWNGGVPLEFRRINLYWNEGRTLTHIKKDFNNSELKPLRGVTADFTNKGRGGRRNPK